MHKLLEAINRGILKGLTEKNIEILTDLDSERLDLLDSMLTKSINNKISVYKYFPTTKEELVEIIKAEVEEKGWNCSLNHIDVSQITDMSYLFGDNWLNDGYNLEKFNGNISRWNVSNVKNMEGMFFNNEGFNRDISKWDVSNVTNMNAMFCSAETFNQPIGDWDVSNVIKMDDMFCLAKSFNQDISRWKSRAKYMFYNCPIKQEYKPKKNLII